MNAVRSANWEGFDPNRADEFKRTLAVADAGTVLLQTTISRVVQLLTLRQMGVSSTLRRVSGSGDKFYSNRRSAATTGAEWVDDTDAATPSEGTYSQVGFEYQTLLGKVKITRLLVARGRSYGDVMATELAGKAEDFAQALEEASVVGNTAANAKSINGLLTLIGNVSGQTVGNTTATAGDALYVTKLDAAIQKVKGSSNRADMRIFANFTGERHINAALQAQQQFQAPLVEIDGGFQVTTYNGIPIVTSTSIPDVLVWNGTDNRVTAFTGGATTALIITNQRYVFYAELTPTRVMPLAKVSSQYDEIEMFTDITLVLDNTLGGSILGGLSGTGV